MAMGTRETDQPPLWIATSDLPTSPGHPFYARLTTLLDGHHVDRFVEGLCDRFYAPVMGRPSLAPGRYFRLLLVGYFEGIDSERGIAWRATDSLAVRSFLRLAVDEAPPDHSTASQATGGTTGTPAPRAANGRGSMRSAVSIAGTLARQNSRWFRTRSPIRRSATAQADGRLQWPHG